MELVKAYSSDYIYYLIVLYDDDLIIITINIWNYLRRNDFLRYKLLRILLE